MARIFYSMAGEGRGHAARVRTLVEHLRREHELWLFAPDDAYDFLARCYGPDRLDPHVQLLRIPGLRFHYTSGRLDLSKTVAAGLWYALRELPSLVSAFRRRIDAERPDLVLCDFEPSLPRAALQAGVPCVSVDHQHVLVADDLSRLPPALRIYAWLMSWVVRCAAPNPTAIVASSFYTPPLACGWEHVHQVGPLIRPEVAQARPVTGDYLVSYLRSNCPTPALEVLAGAGRPVRIYGLGERPPQGNLTFCAIHERRFVDDLAGCYGVVCAAGNQLLGEAVYLGKPVLALPEAVHYEQLINAHYLQQMGVGSWSTLEDFQPATLERFLDQAEAFRTRAAAHCGRLDGTADVLAVIRTHLQPCRRRRDEPLAAEAA